ncbi:MAG: hotdog fold thioesterase [Legionellaceae bacterium]|nr:hotdog fold thioesterase [Legionellaceae bacterium]
MAIWAQPITPETLNQRGNNTMAEWLGIQFTHVGDDTLTATMPASERTKQPLGIVHGGANVVLAETIASTAANAAVDQSRYYCVGLEINANHIRSVRDGLVTGVTRPVHIGRSTHIWLIDLYNDEGKLTCTSRMTASVMTRK